MRQLIEFTTDDDAPIFVEVDISENRDGEIECGRTGIETKARKSFQDALSVVKPVAESIVGKFNNLSIKPEEIGVEFGIKMNAEAGAIIASSGVEANFKITLKWKKE